MNDVEERLRGSFAKQTMMQTLGAELEEAAEGRTRIAAPIADHVLQQQGFAFKYPTLEQALRDLV